LPIPVVLGFVSGPLGPGGRFLLRILLTVVAGLLVAFTALAIFQPLTTLMEGMTSGKK
jgi:hypothetical protein